MLPSPAVEGRADQACRAGEEMGKVRSASYVIFPSPPLGNHPTQESLQPHRGQTVPLSQLVKSLVSSYKSEVRLYRCVIHSSFRCFWFFSGMLGGERVKFSAC